LSFFKKIATASCSLIFLGEKKSEGKEKGIKEHSRHKKGKKQDLTPVFFFLFFSLLIFIRNSSTLENS